MITARTHLKLIEEKDFPLFLEMYQEVDTFKYIPKLQNKTPAEYLSFLRSRLQLVQSSQGYYWAVRSLDTHEFIGALNLYPHARPGIIHLGCQIKRDFWGQGFATEIMAAGRNYGIQVLAMPAIYAFVDSKNIASIRLLEKLHFSSQVDLAGEKDHSTLTYAYFHHANQAKSKY